MKIKTIINITFSILIGTYFALYFTELSQLNRDLGKLLSALIFVICIWTVVSIYREPNEKLKIIQILIFLLAIGIGLYIASSVDDTIVDKNLNVYLYDL